MYDATHPRHDAREWFSLEDAARVMGISTRQVKRRLADLSPDVVGFDRAHRGRPRKMIHWSADQRLGASYLERMRADRAGAADEPDHPLTADELATARLRLQAVQEYEAAGRTMPESAAAAMVVAEWIRGRSSIVEATERIGRHRRSADREVHVGGFSISTLRRWHGDYTAGGRQLHSLAPRRKGRTGRRQIELPEQLVSLVYAGACVGPRADYQKGIEFARRHWQSAWPQVSDSTLIRRCRDLDPDGSCKTLGRSGTAAFMRSHTPDVERDYSGLRYNQLWQLDDITEDFYAISGMAEKFEAIRPRCYAIIRVASREWIAATVSECDLTAAQVRALVGYALASPRGGIPEEILFERGAVACDGYLAETLDALGVKVHRTSMDGGRIHPLALADRGIGHAQGKGVIEANIRRLHNLPGLADQPTQVGPDERLTAHQRLPAMIAHDRERVAAGVQPVFLPTFQEAVKAIFQALELHNNRPHTGLPIVIDPATGERRHATPAEVARRMGTHEVRRMADSYLPLFWTRGEAVRVTRNGILVSGAHYGRFDDELQALAGQSVTVFADADNPGMVYVEQINRCVDLYIPPAYGAEHDLVARKHSIAKTRRNRFERMIDAARDSGAPILADAVRFTAEPVPDRPQRVVHVPALAQRIGRLTAARDDRAAAARRAEARFTFSDTAAGGSGGGLLARAGEIEQQMAAIGAAPHQEGTIHDDADPLA